jgi:hypothetical protein
VLPVHSRGEIPGISSVVCIADGHFPGSIGSALLEVITIGDPVIIMAGATGFFRTERNFTIDREGTPIEPLRDDLFMRRTLGRNRNRIKQAESKEGKDH